MEKLNLEPSLDQVFDRIEQKYNDLQKLIDEINESGIDIADLVDMYESLGFRLEHVHSTVSTQKAYASGIEDEGVPESMVGQFQMLEGAVDELGQKLKAKQ